jgi:hypothetical protein
MLFDLVLERVVHTPMSSFHATYRNARLAGIAWSFSFCDTLPSVVILSLVVCISSWTILASSECSSVFSCLSIGSLVVSMLLVLGRARGGDEPFAYRALIAETTSPGSKSLYRT